MKNRFFFIFVFSIVCSFIQLGHVNAASDASDNVVKVFVTSNSLDFYRPWQSQGSTSMTGSGAIIAGNKILTNAHVVADHTFIQVRKVSDPKKYTARLLAIGYDCDLALLTVDDPEFFKGIKPFEFGDLPKVRDMVTVMGYPRGGDKISITEGVVSRIEITSYVMSSRQLLTVQIDAAINPGNSGGPVLQDGKLVGIAMQGMAESQSIGYMIPMPVVRHFLDDLNDDRYDGFPIAGIDINNTENAALRKYYNISDLEGGVLVTRVMPYSPAYGVLAERDVVLAIDNTPVAMDGTFQFRGNERLALSHLINSKQVGERVRVKFVRSGKVIENDIELKPFVTLVPYPKHFKKPSYYIYGGLVFTVLSMDLLKSWGSKWWEQGPLDFLNYLAGVGRLNEDERKEIVVLLQVLPDDINVGYHGYQNKVIEKVNGNEIKSFEDFVRELHGTEGEFTTLEAENNMMIVLPNKDIEAINAQILERNNIPAQYSEEVAGWLTQDYASQNE